MSRPAIFQIGVVHPDGGLGYPAHWILGSCAWRCGCHNHPDTGQLTIDQDDELGLLGLRKHWVCTCCESWPFEDLAKIVRDLAGSDQLEWTGGTS